MVKCSVERPGSTCRWYLLTTHAKRISVCGPLKCCVIQTRSPELEYFYTSPLRAYGVEGGNGDAGYESAV
jgi:hypothetical protein